MTGSPFLLFQEFQDAAHQLGAIPIDAGGERLRVPFAGPDVVDGLGKPPALLFPLGE